MDGGSIKMKTTTNLSLALIFALTGASASFGDTVVQTTVVTTNSPAPVVVVRDGFTESFSQVLITQNGATKVMQNDMKLRNGVVMHRTGIIVVPGKMNRVLHSGDWLGFDGTFISADTGKVERLRPAD
jgi:hypothetical protein